MKALKFVFLATLLLAFMACNDSRNKDSQAQKAQSADIFEYEPIFADSENQAGQSEILKINVVDLSSEKLDFYKGDGKSLFDKNKPSILLFLRHDCKNCINQAPHIIALKEKYANFLNLYVLASPNDELKDIKKMQVSFADFVKERTIYKPKVGNLTDFLNKDISQGYVALFDKNGEKIIDYVGLTPAEMLERDILFLISSELENSNIARDNVELSEDE